MDLEIPTGDSDPQVPYKQHHVFEWFSLTSINSYNANHGVLNCLVIRLNWDCSRLPNCICL